MEKVYILLLNYKGHLDTIECLESCLKLNYPNFHIVVVDNSPTNSSITYIMEWAKGKIKNLNTNYENIIVPVSPKPIEITLIDENNIFIHKASSQSKITLIKAKENNGFAAGNNIGIKYIQQLNDHRFIWLLNNDSVVHPESLQELVSFWTENKNDKLGIIGSTLVNYFEPEKIQALGGLFNKWFATSKHLAEGLHINNLKFINTAHIDYVVGASMFTSKEFLNNVGLLYEGYFLYFEEIDWVSRALNMGYKIGICKESIVYHKEGASIGTGRPMERSELSDLLCLKNRIRFTKRSNKLYLPTVYAGFFIVILNRIRRRQFKRVIKIVQLLFGTDKIP